jgi:blue copper oxidase
MRKGILFCFAWACAAFLHGQNALQIPQLITGTVFNLQVAEDSTQFLPGAKTRTFGISKPYLAPVLELHRGDFVQMNVTNSLSDTTTMHWHGMHVPSASDGGPHTPIAPGTTWSPAFTVLDEASTLWYHPHLHYHTAEQVYWGAAGMIIVRDSFEAALNLPRRYGIDDFPMIIQDKSFDSTTNQFIYEAMSDTMMVNGTLNPALEVPAQVVRFRFLNASNQRVYYLGFPPNISYMIASDGGLLEEPLPITRILLAPGERTEVLINFTNTTGNRPLFSFSSEMDAGISGGPSGPGGGPGNPLDGIDFRVCDFNIGPPTPNPVTTIPTTLRTYDIPNAQNAAKVRSKYFDAHPAGYPYFINSTPYVMEYVNDTMRLGDIEVWDVINYTDVAHPLHLHDIQFHVLERNGEPAPDHMRGRKDVVLLQPNDTIRFVTQFTTFADQHTPYMYHCHNLFHEDDGMMAQFIVLDTAVSGHEDATGYGGRFKLYPNPTRDIVYLQDENVDEERISEISLCDLQGRVLISATTIVGAGPHQINLSEYPAGMYLLHLRHRGGGYTVRRLLRQ